MVVFIITLEQWAFHLGKMPNLKNNKKRVTKIKEINDVTNLHDTLITQKDVKILFVDLSSLKNFYYHQQYY